MAADFSDAFRLRSDAVARHVIASAGWAFRLHRRAEEMRVDDEASSRGRDRLAHAAASGYTVAASYASMYSPALGELLFWTASSLYLVLDSPRLFGAVLGACTHGRELRRAWAQRALERREPTRDDLYAIVALLAAPDLERREALIMDRLNGVDRRRGAHVTELFVPASTFLSALAPLLPENSIVAQRARSRRDGLARLMDAYTEQAELARAYSAWESMTGRFLPVSPEVLATLLLVGERLETLAFEPDDSTELHDLPEMSRAMVRIARDVFELRLELDDPAFASAGIFRDLRERRLRAS